MERESSTPPSARSGGRGSGSGAKKLSEDKKAVRVSPRIEALKAAKRAEMLKLKKESTVEVIRDPFQSAVDSAGVVRGNTGLVYDKAMLEHFSPWDPEHIEGPERLEGCRQRIDELGLTHRCTPVPAREALDEEILLAHSQNHLDTLSATQAQTDDELKEFCLSKYHATYLNRSSVTCARLAAGAAVDVSAAVFKGDLQNGLALVRPPGHHATRETCSGFCVFNNVGIATKNLIENLGAGRVLIVDFDVHHGQATQQLFYGDSRVLYVSIHRYEHGKFAPYLRESNYDYIGEKNGTGFNANIPLNESGMDESDYLAAFHQIILPLAYEFCPEIVIISAGYDSAIGCPEGGMRLNPLTYGHIMTSLMALAQGKVSVILEGGYLIDSLAEGVSMTLRALLGDFCLPIGALGPPNPSMVTSILSTLCALRPHWRNLQVQDQYCISEYDSTVDQNCFEPMLLFEGDAFLKMAGFDPALYDPSNKYFRHPPDKLAEVKSVVASMKATYSHLLEVPQSTKVAIAYDSAMTRHHNLSEPGHPEKPERVKGIMARFEEFGLTKRSNALSIDSRRATKEEICLAHDEAHYEEMKELSTGLSQDELNERAEKYDSIYFHPDTFDCALLSCGTLLNVVDSVCNGDAGSGVAVIRPPGHHAETDEACGFCIFNNVAMAAMYALNSHDLKRVLILDWDVHHGNGIQNIFYQDPRVLYISIHRYDNGTFFPASPEANFDQVGEGKGEGFNINIPWNGPGMGDPEYVNAFFNVVLPVAYQFDPQLVLISAGFDAARGDPLGKCQVSPEMYGHMVVHLRNLAKGNLILALEGGYNVNSISLSMSLCVKALFGDPMPAVVQDRPPKPGALQSIRDVIRQHSKYWSCLAFDQKLPDSFQDLRQQLGENFKHKDPHRMTEQKKDVKKHSGGCLDVYVPSEFGSSVGSSLVYTLSNELSKREHEGVLSDSQRRKDEEVSCLAKDMTGIDIARGATSSLAAAASSQDYIPFEYGRSYGSPFVNTFSNSFGAANFVITSAPRYSSGVNTASTDTKTSGSTATVKPSSMAGSKPAV